MEYRESMRRVADLIERRELEEARNVLGSILATHPGDRIAQACLVEIDRVQARGHAAPSDWRPTTVNIPTMDQVRDLFIGRVKAVRESISEVTSTPWHEIPVDVELCEIGLDSVGIVHLEVVLEERFNIEIHDEDMDDLESMTVRQIAGWLAAPSRSRRRP